MKAQVCLFFIAVVLVVSAFGQSGDPPQVYCGRSLANMMAALCYTKYDKRSDYNSVHLGYEPEFGWPWMGTTRGLPQRHMQDRDMTRGITVRDMNRGKRGIIEDCCEQSCSIQTLMGYC